MGQPEHSLRTIFAEALEIGDGQQRAAFIAHACRGNPALLEDIEALLKAESAASPTFLPNAPQRAEARRLSQGTEELRLSEAMPAALCHEKPGDQLGRYKLLEQLGEG